MLKRVCDEEIERIKPTQTRPIFTRATLASMGISCHPVCLSVRPSICLSHVGVLLTGLNINVGSCKQCHMIAQELCFSDAENLGKTRTGWPPVEAPKPSAGGTAWGRLNAGAVAAYWRLSMQGIANLARSQVYHTERPRYVFAAHLLWCSASRGSDPCCGHFHLSLFNQVAFVILIFHLLKRWRQLVKAFFRPDTLPHTQWPNQHCLSTEGKLV